MSTRKLLFTILITVFAIVSASLAFAQDATVTLTTTQVVNVRSGPGTKYTLRGTLQPKTHLTVTGRNDFPAGKVCTGQPANDLELWLRVQFNEIEGWVNRCAVTVEGNVDTLPVVTPSNGELNKDLQYPAKILYGSDVKPDGNYIYAYTRDMVLLREDHDLNSTVLGVIPAERGVYVIGRSEAGGWVQVLYRGHKGWVAGHLIDLNGSWKFKIPVVD